MSERTSTILINKTNITSDTLKGIVKNKSYLFTVNENWTGLAIKDGQDYGIQCSKKLSSKLNCYILNYEFNEDYYWLLNLFKDGQELGKLIINFEDDDIQRSGIEEFEYIFLNKMHYHSFCQSIDSEEYLNTIGLFKKLLEIEKLEWVSYEYFETWDNSELLKWNVQSINQRKKVTFNQKIESLFGDILSKNGLHLALYSVKDQLYYEKEINDFKYTLFFSTLSKNRLDLACHMPFKSKESPWKVLYFNNQKKLDELLNKDVKDFIYQSIDFINNNSIELNKNDLYENNITTQILSSYGYNKKILSNNENGLLAVYENESIILRFYHGPGFATFNGLTLVNKIDNSRIDLIDLINLNWRYFEFNNFRDIDFSFRNFEEFYMNLKLLLDLTQKYLKDPSYNFTLY